MSKLVLVGPVMIGVNIVWMALTGFNWWNMGSAIVCTGLTYVTWRIGK